MTDETQPEPQPGPQPEAQPAPQPEAQSAPQPEAQSAPQPEAQPATQPEAQPATQPAPQQGADQQPGTPRQRDRVLGMTAQTAGVVGFIVCLVLAVLVIFGRGWLVGWVDDLSAKVDDGLAKAVPILDTASSAVDDIATRVGEVADAADAQAANPGPAASFVQGLVDKANAVSDRYLALRQTYYDAREQAITALDRLNAIDRLVPGISVPQGPVDALTTLDERVRALDSAVMGLIDAIPQGGSAPVASAIADKARTAQTALNTVSTTLDTAQTRLDGARSEVASWANTAQTLVNVAAIILVIAFLYSALLHWVLYRSGSRLRKGDG